MFTLNDRKVSYLLVQAEFNLISHERTALLDVALFPCLLGALYCRFNSYLLLLEAKLEEQCAYGFDVTDVSFDDSCFSCSF